MSEVHDRKPLVLPPDAARAWIDLATLQIEAEYIVQYHAATANTFEWYPVSHAVGECAQRLPEANHPDQ